MLKTSLLPSKTLLLFAAACLVWLVLISAVVMCFTGIASPAGWIFAGALFGAMLLAVLMVSREYRNAIELVETDAVPGMRRGETPFGAGVTREAFGRGSRGSRGMNIARRDRIPVSRERRHRPGQTPLR